MATKADKSSYLGNKNLKRVDIPVEFTKKEIQEFIKCSRDPVYFIENYMKIVHVDRGLIPFIPFSFQKDIVRLFEKERFVICKMPRQVGKALDVNTPILTNNGFTILKDLQIGDSIYGDDGKLTTVVSLTDTMYDHEVFDVEFDNGDIITADENHLWKVDSSDWRTGERVLTTEQLIPFISHTNKPYINITKCLDFKQKHLLIDPYTLGLWLGDGDTNGARITSHKDDELFYRTKIDIKNYYEDKRNNNVIRFKIPGGQSVLKALGVYGNKHIPNDYLFSSKEQRLELLRGLMDSDGSTSQSGSCEFYQKNTIMVDQVRTLLSSLGIKSKKSLKNGMYWTVRFNTNERVFNLPRKHEKHHCKGNPKNTRLYIKKITKRSSVPVKCLQVNNYNKMFLCGETLIPTHNSTIVAGIILHTALFNENYSIAILANKEKQAQEILGRIQLAYEHLPKWLQQGIVEWNKKSIDLENGSRIIASSTASSAIRGTSQNLVYLDEFAFVPNNIQEEFLSSVYPTISSGETTKILITSTPNGLNLFYKIWTDSMEGRNDYKRIDVHWSDVPGRDEAWKKETIRNTSEEQFLQEFECEFLGSSGTLIDGRVLGRLTYDTPIVQNDSFKLFHEPRTAGSYVITVDTSRGLNQDYSAFLVIDISELPYKVVASYRDNAIEPMLYPEIIYSTALRFNNAVILVEINDIGQQVADILHQDLEYDNLLYTMKGPTGNIELSGGFKQGATRGIRTTKQTKRLGCSNLKALIENNKLLVSDYQVLYELQRFVVINGSYAAEQGNDDLVMCLVLFAWITTQQLFIDTMDVSVRKNLLLLKQEDIDQSVPQFGFIDDRMYEEDEPIVNTSDFDKFLLN